jgi:hypothetical protein
LESFHRLLTCYNWLSVREPVAFHSFDELARLAPIVECALQWAIEETVVGAARVKSAGTMKETASKLALSKEGEEQECMEGEKENSGGKKLGRRSGGVAVGVAEQVDTMFFL